MTFKRREFLTTSALAVAGAASFTLTSLFAADEKPKRQLKKAIMWSTIGYKGTVLEKCRAVKAAGFEGVELMSHMKQDEVMAALDDTGLKAASVCGALHWSKPLSHPDEKVRAEGLAGLKQALRDAKLYGATSVLLVPGVAREGVTYEQCWDRSIAEIRNAIPVCEETGVKIAIENVGNNFLMKPEQAKQYLEAINDPWVGFHFDIGNHVRYGASEEWIKVLGKQILKLHIKDYSTKPAADGKAPGSNVKLLEGDNNWPVIMRELDRIGYQGWAITEQPGNQTKDAESLKEFSERLSRLLAS